MGLRPSAFSICEKIVVVSDIFCSVKIMEELQSRDKLQMWGTLVCELDANLQSMVKDYDVIKYKFIGDGWILLFGMKSPGEELLSILECLRDKYQQLFKKRLFTVIDGALKAEMSFGIDVGRLIVKYMDKKAEYIGRPINVATRLQHEPFKKNAKGDYFQVRMTKEAYSHLRSTIQTKWITNKYDAKLKHLYVSDRFNYIGISLKD